MEKETLYIKELALGSHDAFRCLFMSYFPRVKYFIKHLTKSEPIAEELAQDVFMKIWEQREQLAIIESFKYYEYKVFIVVHNYLGIQCVLRAGKGTATG